MKRRYFMMTGVMALAMILAPLSGQPSAQAGNIVISGGGGGGGGGNAGVTDARGTGGGGGGGVIVATNPANSGGTGGPTDGGAGGAGGTAGGTAGGNGNTNGGAVGTGGTASNIGGGSGGAADGSDGTAAGQGGGGGNAFANTADMTAAAVGNSDNVSILGGSGGNGGTGNASTFSDDPVNVDGPTFPGWNGGGGGRGGDASLTWDSNDHTIGSLNVLAGTNGTGVTDWTDHYTDPVTGQTSYGSSGGGAGSASFTLDGALTANGPVNVQARDNYAEFTSNGLTANGATTITSSNYHATMDIHGNARLSTLTVTSGGSGLASFVADGTGAVTTTGVTDVIASSTGNAVFESVSYHGGDTTKITANNAGDARMTVSGGGNSVSSLGTLTVSTGSGSGNASFKADNAGTVKITGSNQHLTVSTDGSGTASFSADSATVSVAQGNLTIDSSASDAASGTASFLARGLNIAGTATIKSGLAAATAEVTGTQVSVNDLNITAGENTASFIANGTELLHVNIVNINGTSGGIGDAKLEALAAKIETNNDDVTISTAGALGGTKGLYAARLETGNDQVMQANNGIVTLIGNGGGASQAQLVLTDSLQTRELNLEGRDTAQSLNTNINRVDVTWLDTTFNFVDTVASTDEGLTGVYFKTIDLGNDTQVRTLDATNATLGTYWADTLKVNLTAAPTTGQQWVGDLWLGGSPYDGGLLAASGTVGVLDVMLPAGVSLANYYGTGDGTNTNYMLAVNGNLTLEDGAAVNLKAVSGNPFKDLNVDEQLQIVSSTNAITDNTTDGVAVNGYSELGASTYLFDMLVSDDGEKLLAKFLGGDLNVPVAKTYLEGVTAALGTINLGAELENRVLRNSFDPYSNSGLFKNGSNLGVMFGLEYTDMRLNSGSHVDSDNMNIVIGPALRSENALGRLGLGLFFEAGYGDYSAHNSFPTLEVIGEGETKYFGGGLGLRHDFARGFYTDLSMRAGSVTTDLKIKDRLGAEYDMSTSYFGGHAGFGKIFDFEDSGRLDLSARLLWARLGGDEVMTRAEERLSIDDAKSLRTQLGARYSRSFNDTVAGYVGGAWEYESDGTVSGHLDDVRIDEPSLKGSTGIAEVGFSLTPGNNVSIDLGLQGYTGQREGAGGTAMLSVSF